MLTHKDVNTFIRKYNKQVVIKGYSKMKLANKMALVESRLKEKKSGKYGLEVEARLEWGQLIKKGKGVVDKDREGRKEAFFEKKKEEAKKEKDKPKPKIVVKASAIKKKNGSSSKPKVVVKAKLVKKKVGTNDDGQK